MDTPHQPPSLPAYLPTPLNFPCGSVRRKQRVPSQATPDYYTPIGPINHSLRRALARKYSTKGPSQSTTISQVAYSVAIPIEYPQEKALPPPLNKCPPPHITHTHRPTPRLSQWGRRAKKSIGYTHSQPAKSHPTNVPPPGNRPTTTNRPDRSTDTTQKEEQNNSYTKRVGKKIPQKDPSARTRADQHK